MAAAAAKEESAKQLAKFEATLEKKEGEQVEVVTEADLKALFPREHWNRLHLQIIFYGREHCTARGCDGTVCKLCRELYPKRRKPVIWRKP